jgi:hypothetical protein
VLLIPFRRQCIHNPEVVDGSDPKRSGPSPIAGVRTLNAKELA